MDPSMLIAFLIRDEKDWEDWRQGVQEVQGKAVIQVADREPVLSMERDSAIDEVETFDDDDDDDTILDA
jgi:cysteine protease ATG4